ncbi:dihydrofolate reductase [Paenibacillus sp. YYML68]|uniref:dihydrofolate reductase n=1 Tax=Paenibacillus sp. YYML68 TaxID=2909250 RepID=UPI002490E740|nr:dihydrofolate reductase [Paenibacillus sp. YYML68]
MTISLIAAMDQGGGIGHHNKMPWHLPADLQYFKRTTMGAPVLMGRKTFESIGCKPLPGRRNIVLTRDEQYAAEGCEVVSSVDDIVSLYGQNGDRSGEELFVIGGAEVYKLLLPAADKLYLTEIARRFEADAFFPEVTPEEWQVTSRTAGVKDERNPYDYEFVVYERAR